MEFSERTGVTDVVTDADRNAGLTLGPNRPAISLRIGLLAGYLELDDKIEGLS